jgi:hypothetical protein
VRSARFLIGLAAVLGVLLLPAAGSASAAVLFGTVSGQAPEQEAKPLVGATVTAYQSASGEKVASATTDESGKYTIELASGVYDVHFEMGSGSFEATTVKAVEVTDSRSLSVVLAATAVTHLTGTIVDAAGKPVVDARVFLNTGSGAAGSATTGADGSYDLAAPPGKYGLTVLSSSNVEHPGLPQGWAASGATVELSSAQTLDLKLPPTHQLTVEALGAEGAPIAGAGVRVPALAKSADLGGIQVTYLQSRGSRGGDMSATTGADGRASFTVFGGARFEEQARAEVVPPAGSGYGRIDFDIEPVEGDTTVTVQFGAGEEEEEEAEDVEPPQLKGLTIEPTEIDTSSSKQPVTVALHISDDQAGFKEAVVFFRSPSGESFTSGSCAEPVSGTDLDGVCEAVVAFEQGSETGEWTIFTIGLFDKAGREAKISQEELEKAELPYAVTVIGQDPTQPSVSLTSSPNPSVRGQKVTFTAKVTPAEGAPQPLGTIAFVEGTTTLGVVNLSSKGTAIFNTTALGAGSHPVIARYSGDEHSGAADSPTVTQVVAKAATQLTLVSSLNPSPYGSAATLKATVKAVAPGAGTPAGTVTFREGEATLATVQLSGSNATYRLKDLPPGTHEITATYNGDDPNYEASKAAALTQTIDKASTELTLTSSLNPAPYGAAGTLKASVDAVAPGGGTPAGTVTFREGEAVLAAVPLSSAGIATYPLKALSPGAHEITATYSGNANYGASEAVATQTIVKASTALTLTSTKNPAAQGASGTLKATVKAVAPGTGVPAGTVTFSEGEATLAIIPLSSGAASLPLKSLPAGSHEITARYSGGSNYESSEGAIVQVISP